MTAYVQAFTTVRAIASLHELSECLKEFVPQGQDFESMQLGPLIKLPIVYNLFKVPQDSQLHEIDTADILEYLRLYLSQNVSSRSLANYVNPYPAKLIYLNFQPLKVVSCYRDPHS